ncbi:MAG: pancreas/duodenum homeobox protein 1 [Desulforhopalus sp.]|nr:pancreas/duodenum homeobox protein 1 [Desulforhopalus sp.]
MTTDTLKTVFTKEKLAAIFPATRSNDFFEALFGDASEGAYDIELAYRELRGNTLTMELRLHERPGRCLACNLTQGLPQVFSRHPVINVQGIVKDIEGLLGGTYRCLSWSLGYTGQHSRSVHAIPLNIVVEKN